MKCSKCGFENKDKAKFCTKCGNSLVVQTPASAPAKSDNTKYIIIALIAVIVVLVGTIGFFALNNNSGNVQSADASQESADSQDVKSVDDSGDDSDEDDSAKTTKVSSSKSSSSSKSDSKDWVSIGSYSGSGSGSESITVPEGKIMVKLSAYPIKNYATNHLYVTGSNGESGGVDWGSKSAVETRSDSFTYTSDSEEVFTIDYYETVSWEVEFFRYQ
jgi:predicted  nucleic acid-binding Zn-ribbon protein